MKTSIQRQYEADLKSILTQLENGSLRTLRASDTSVIQLALDLADSGPAASFPCLWGISSLVIKPILDGPVPAMRDALSRLSNVLAGLPEFAATATTDAILRLNRYDLEGAIQCLNAAKDLHHLEEPKRILRDARAKLASEPILDITATKEAPPALAEPSVPTSLLREQMQKCAAAQADLDTALRELQNLIECHDRE